MEFSQERKPPVEFITVYEEYDSISAESNDSFELSSKPHHRLGGISYCERLRQISQPQNPVYRTDRDGDASVTYSACLPPSLTRTNKSYDDDGSSSIDLTAVETTTHEELSIDLGNDAFFKTRDENLLYGSDDDDSSSIDLIAEMISNDELSIDLLNITHFETGNENLSYDNSTCIPHSFTSSIAAQRIDEMKNRRRSLEIKYQQQKIQLCTTPKSARSSPITIATEHLKSPPTSTFSPSPSTRIRDMKNKLRLFENGYERYKCVSSANDDSTAQQDDTAFVTGVRKLGRCDTRVASSGRRRKSTKTPPMDIVLEMAVTTICIGIILGFFYFIFTLYQMSITAVVQQENNIRLSLIMN